MDARSDPSAEMASSPLERSVQAMVAAFRWLSWIWVALVFLVTRAEFRHLYLAGALVVAALGWTVLTTLAARRAPGLLARPAALIAELALGAALLIGDGWTHTERTIGSASQSLASAWPVAGLMTTGFLRGPYWGGAAGVVLGAARAYGTTLNPGFSQAGWTGGNILSMSTTTVLYMLTGVVGGLGGRRLRTAQAQIAAAQDAVSAAKAREDVARTLHDGVLQTLAFIQRRSREPELVELARDQERELRSYLFGVTDDHTELVGELRALLDRSERRDRLRTSLVVVEEPAGLSPDVTAAVIGAVREALTNAAKHADAKTVTVFVDAGDDAGVFCSVHDDGVGFDPATVTQGVGLSRSILARVEEVGGRVELDSKPGHGTEVRLWV